MDVPRIPPRQGVEVTATWRIGAVAVSVIATHPGEWAVRIEEPPTRNLVVPFGADLDDAARFAAGEVLARMGEETT